LIKKEVAGQRLEAFILSPDEQYVLFFDPVQRNYFSYERVTGKIRNLTSSINGKWTALDREDEPKPAYYPLGIGGFFKNSNSVLLYGQYDVFKVDLSGKEAPVNLTNGYGQKYHIIFRLAMKGPYRPHEIGDAQLFSTFNTTTKEAGFYEIAKGSDPGKLTMQPAKFTDPIKAEDSNIYMVKRMDVSRFPNLYLTSDFRNFKPVTDIHPEEKYNWMSSELISFTCLDGSVTQGVLYKPQDFNPNKKYPLIFYFYEQLSDDLHEYMEPVPSEGTLDIPLYVSNGYLVFTPDIHYKVGHPGQSAYNTIIAAANYLKQKPYVDGKKMALQGMSFGGFQTNYIITHSHLFAAAMSASGMTDFVSIYNSVIGNGSSRQRQYELYRDRIGATLWERPDLYIENSPILRANFVQTPLLMMANNNDGDVPHQQGIEFFTGLRRLGKKVWMLQYDGQEHGLGGPTAPYDLSTRMFQFFNHYLKGAPAPVWMTKGVPARMKGIESGLELDTSGEEP
jgi:dienelactone hydrolase